MKKEGRVYGWSTEGWKPTKGCLSQPWPCSSGSFLSNAEKYTRLTLLPRILPAGRNFGQITEIKLAGNLRFSIIHEFFYFDFGANIVVNIL
jgi:hypothetical protein